MHARVRDNCCAHYICNRRLARSRPRRFVRLCVVTATTLLAVHLGWYTRDVVGGSRALISAKVAQLFCFILNQTFIQTSSFL